MIFNNNLRDVEQRKLGGVCLCFAIRYSSRVCLFALESKCMMPAFAYAGLLAYVGGLNACANIGGCGERYTWYHRLWSFIIHKRHVAYFHYLWLGVYFESKLLSVYMMRVVNSFWGLWTNQPYARTMPPTPTPDGGRRRLASL